MEYEREREEDEGREEKTELQVGLVGKLHAAGLYLTRTVPMVLLV